MAHDTKAAPAATDGDANAASRAGAVSSVDGVMFIEPRSAQIENVSASAIAAAKASATFVGSPEISPRPASRNAVVGLIDASAWIQPETRSSGT